MKKLLHKILLTAVALMAAVGAQAYDVVVDGIYYNLNTNKRTASVTHEKYNNGGYSGKVDIPASVVANGEEYAVTGIGNLTFFGCSALTSITLPDGITEIGEEAFYECSSLTSISLPAGLTTLWHRVFEGCSALTSVTLPDGLWTIGDNVFDGCSALTSIHIPDGVRYIGEFVFKDCRSLASVNIPDGVTDLGYGVFQHCSALTSIRIPAGITLMSGGMFSGCTGLTSVGIPADVTKIEAKVFSYCRSLATVYSFNTVAPAAGFACFEKLPEDATLYVPEGCVEAYRNAPEWSNFKNIKEFDPTGISDVKANRSSKNARYDLNGRRLTAPAKGLNIVDGRKVMVK